MNFAQEKRGYFVKRCLSMFFAVFLLFVFVFTGFAGGQKVYASGKTTDTRAIAIVFDNSGSMYIDGIQAWCRATYAMEVFASMLNKGDTLLIYPMHPIEVNGKQYTMENPFRVTDATQASAIRDIYTPKALGTPIESVDNAAKGLQGIKADKKYMIVLTDGEAFYLNGREMSASKTKQELDARFQAQMGKMTVMYLGIGSNVVMPDTQQSEYFVKKQAKDSENVLSSLTEMCNQIFGRDTLPKSRISGKQVEFDISMSKLIVFVQGENVSGLKVTGASGAVGQQQSVISTKYGTAGCGNYKSVADTSLQGMMVTYTDCAAGSYTIDYTGKATSIEVYYEPNADLDFVFTDAEGNVVDPSALYEGDYKVSFGMKDAKTGKLISSDLLGAPHYQGSYSINGQEYPFTHDGYSGEVSVPLKMGDTFEANLTVTYLSGYTITKDSSDFGWPFGGIQVVARPAGDFKLEITGGDALYSLMDLGKGAPYTVKAYYQGEQLTGTALESVDLKWDPESSHAEIKKEFAGDHYKLSLHYKDPSSPQDTVCGECTVLIRATYTAEGSQETQTQAALSYNIKDDFSPLKIEMSVPDDYIVISELQDSRAIVLNLTMNGAPLTAEEFAAVQLQADCGGIAYTLTPNEQGSSYTLQLLATEGIEEGDYTIRATAQFTDRIGRVTQTESLQDIYLSKLPLWVKWLIWILLLLLLLIIILLILHIKRLPKYVSLSKADTQMVFDGDDITEDTRFNANIKRGRMEVYAITPDGTSVGLSISVKPGKDSYLRTPQKSRKASVRPGSVSIYGGETVKEINIGSANYVLNENTNELERDPDKPYDIKDNTYVEYTGLMMDGGRLKTFRVNTKLKFKKK